MVEGRCFAVHRLIAKHFCAYAQISVTIVPSVLMIMTAIVPHDIALQLIAHPTTQF